MPEISLDELEREVLNHPDPVVTVAELARELEPSDTHIRSKLESLEYVGRVRSKDTGANATAWWHVERVVGPPVDASERRDETPAEPPADSDAATDAPVSVERAMQMIDLPGSGEKLERRREAFRALLEKLRDAPGATNDLYAPTWEPTGYDSASSWRSNAAGPALGTLADRGVVECADPSAGEWRWLGE